jgi:predicted Zn finger-like uncharacterized protein
MIIQCEKCKTRFKLDDSRITDSGVRVRCSRCSHTFVVMREAPEDGADFESILLGFGENEPSGNDAENAGLPGGFTIGQTSEETASSEPDETEGEEPSPVENLAETGFPPEPRLEAEDDQQSEFSPGEYRTDSEEENAESEQPEILEQCFADVLEKDEELPPVHISPDVDIPETGSDATADEGSSAFSSLFGSQSAKIELPVDEVPECSVPSPRGEALDGPIETPFSAEPEPSLSIREHIWPVADSKDEEGIDDELSPLSISSRRKGSPVLPFLIGILLILLLGGAGFYLLTGQSGGLAGLVPDSVKALFGLGMKAGGLVEIRSLEGEFLANKDAGEIFVIKGDAFNVSSKPLTTIQVKGKIFGPQGAVFAQQTIFCGNVLSGEQLALQPYSSMEKVLGKQFGETLANLEVSPGKGIPFMIVFRNVPKGSTDFGVEVVSPNGANAR